MTWNRAHFFVIIPKDKHLILYLPDALRQAHFLTTPLFLRELVTKNVGQPLVQSGGTKGETEDQLGPV